MLRVFFCGLGFIAIAATGVAAQVSTWQTSAAALLQTFGNTEELTPEHLQKLPVEIRRDLGVAGDKEANGRTVFSQRLNASTFILAANGNRLNYDSRIILIRGRPREAALASSWQWKLLVLPFLRSDGTIGAREDHYRLSWNSTAGSLQHTECTDLLVTQNQYTCARTLYRVTWSDTHMFRVEVSRDQKKLDLRLGARRVEVPINPVRRSVPLAPKGTSA